MRRLSVMLALCLMSLAGSAIGQDPEAESLNKPPEGFTAIFNGEDLAGWIGVPHFDPRELRAMSPDERQKFLDANWVEVEKHWSVEDGELVNDGQGPYLTTAEDYGDFELRLEYKTVAKADSGIYLRGCPQVQIWDTTQEGGKWDRLANKGSGGLFNNQKTDNFPLVHADKPFGEWNSLVITMIGENVTVVYNDKLVVNDLPLENYFDRSIPVFPLGPIQLQTHGGEIRFKNVFLKEIPRKPPEAGHLSAEGTPYGDGWKSLLEDPNALTQSGDSEYHVVFNMVDGEDAKITFGEHSGDANGMSLTISEESGVTVTDLALGESGQPVANTPVEASGLKADGPQHIYARIQGEWLQMFLNGKSVIDVLYPQRPQTAGPSVSGMDIRAAFVRNAQDDERVPTFGGDEEGFEPIFNGTDLSGWTGDVDGYAAEAGVLKSQKEGGNLLTEGTYSDFQFRFEFKLGEGGNNGVGLRAPSASAVAYEGIESQILDNTSPQYATIEPYQAHGSIYGVVPAKRGYLMPPGYWNQEEITVQGNHFKVVVNGKVIVDADVTEAIEGGTIDGKEHPGLKNKEGHIGFLGHGHQIEFRNLRVKSLAK